MNTNREKCKHEGCRSNTERENGFCRAHCPVLQKRAREIADEKYTALLADGFLRQKDEVRKYDECLCSYQSKINAARRTLYGLESDAGKIRSVVSIAQSLARLTQAFEVAKESKNAEAMLSASKAIDAIGRKIGDEQ